MAIFIFPSESAFCEDTYAQEDAPGSVHGSDAGFSIRGTTAARRNALIRFTEIVSQIPSAWTVSQAILSLRNVTEDATARTFNFYAPSAANAGWTPALTWNFRLPSSQRWPGDTANDGGTDAGCSVATTDYVNTLLGTIVYNASAPANTEHTIDLTTSVQTIVTSGVNPGWLILAASAFVAFAFHAADGLTPEYRPKLTVTAGPSTPPLGKRGMIDRRTFGRGWPHGVIRARIRG